MGSLLRGVGCCQFAKCTLRFEGDTGSDGCVSKVSFSGIRGVCGFSRQVESMVQHCVRVTRVFCETRVSCKFSVSGYVGPPRSRRCSRGGCCGGRRFGRIGGRLRGSGSCCGSDLVIGRRGTGCRSGVPL